VEILEGHRPADMAPVAVEMKHVFWKGPECPELPPGSWCFIPQSLGIHQSIVQMLLLSLLNVNIMFSVIP
jgi:hypothetical protein